MITNAQWQVKMALEKAKFDNKDVVVGWQVLEEALEQYSESRFDEGYQEGYSDGQAEADLHREQDDD